METKQKLLAVINLHQKMSRSYFYTPPYLAAARRSYEEYNSLDTEVVVNGHTYRIVQETSCSCRHVYYSVHYYEDGEEIKADIRFVKKLLKQIS